MRNQVSIIEKATLSINKLYDLSKVDTLDKVIEYATVNSSFENATRWNRARLIYLYAKFSDNKKAVEFAQSKWGVNKSQTYSDILTGTFIAVNGKHSVFAVPDENDNNIMYDFNFTALAEISKIWKNKANAEWKKLTKAERGKTKGQDIYIIDYIFTGIKSELEKGLIAFDMSAKDIKDIYDYKNLTAESENPTAENENTTAESENPTAENENTTAEKVLTIQEIFNHIIKYCSENGTNLNAIIEYYNSLNNSNE